MSKNSRKLTKDEICRKLCNGELIIVDNSNKKYTASFWKDGKIGLPAEPGSLNDSQPKIIKDFAVCRKCKHVFNFDPSMGTSNLTLHLNSCWNAGKPSASGGGGTSTLAPSVADFMRKPYPQSAKDAVVDAAVQLVCLDLRPYYAIEGPGMISLAQSLINFGSKYGPHPASDIMPSRNTLRFRIEKTAQEAQITLKSILIEIAPLGCIAFSLDFWTDAYAKTTFLDVTAHYVDGEYEFRSQVVKCSEFPESRKTAENILETVKNLLLECVGISYEQSISYELTWVMDGAANLNKAFEDSNRVKCADHKLNIILRSSWDELL
jgi:hypothetical protein